MTPETIKLIESVQVFYLDDIDATILKSDFDRIIEELTKWNKVEDGLPPITNKKQSRSKDVLIKSIKSDQIYIGFLREYTYGLRWVVPNFSIQDFLVENIEWRNIF